MKKILITLSVLTLMSCASTSSDFSGDRQPSQVTGNIGKEFSADLGSPCGRALNPNSEIIKYFLTLANDSKSVVYSKIEEKREEVASLPGLMQSEEFVPNKISSKNIVAIILNNYSYTGKVDSDGNIEDAPDFNESVLITVPFMHRTYGGRIETIESVVYVCSAWTDQTVKKEELKKDCKLIGDQVLASKPNF